MCGRMSGLHHETLHSRLCDHPDPLEGLTHLQGLDAHSAPVQVSFHKYGDFFPGTGALADTGHSGGHNYSVNVPLQEGMDDESYCLVFEPVMQKVP